MCIEYYQRSRSSFLREANFDAELDARIYQLGDFQRIMSAAKRAKRIGLLFSEAQLDYNLDPRLVKDIEDIRSGDELFSDGCGLISGQKQEHHLQRCSLHPLRVSNSVRWRSK
ncbi:hypothetical protein DFH06DRAFT_629030 [Mycena polygramma]|nr:hypothetical protein DFH06DRAFT_629030 [Mycena polygramma]